MSGSDLMWKRKPFARLVVGETAESLSVPVVSGEGRRVTGDCDDRLLLSERQKLPLPPPARRDGEVLQPALLLRHSGVMMSVAERSPS